MPKIYPRPEPAPKNAGTFKVSDALGHLRGLTDQNHKYWGYFQAFTVAAVALAWSTGAKDSWPVAIGVSAAYLLFSILNCRVLKLGQETARETWQAIQTFMADHPTEVDSAFARVLAMNEPDSVRLVVLGQRVQTGVVVALILTSGVASCLARWAEKWHFLQCAGGS